MKLKVQNFFNTESNRIGKPDAQNNKRPTVFVGLSGGVDSSVSAYLLKKSGYNVVGAFIKIWQPEFADTCTWKEDRRSAMRVAAHLGIPFVTIDLSDEYKRGVIDYMIREYSLGRTPNPDVMCNREIKFKAFLNKALEMGADMIATGHYARVESGKMLDSNSHERSGLPSTFYSLCKAIDVAKEQSYFLWTLTQKELSKTLLPIGGLPKKEVRKIAEKAGLHTFEKKDSQGLCFIGKVDFKDFLKHYIKPKRGDVLNEHGEVIGVHDGVMFLTIGERRGFTIIDKGTNDEPMYVVDKNIDQNTITVAGSERVFLPNTDRLEFDLIQTNWISAVPEQNKVYDAQVRYHQDYQKCKIEPFQGQSSGLGCVRSDLKEVEKSNCARIIFDNPQTGAKGQSVVVYDGDVCLGGGVIN
jgi:tRNA-uridine 2-sulfurtransferase